MGYRKPWRRCRPGDRTLRTQIGRKSDGDDVKYSQEQELELMSATLAFRDDPRGFVTYTYPWGEAGTPLHDKKEPHTWQIEEFELLGEHMKRVRFAVEQGLPIPIYRAAYSSGRGPGKSAFFGMTAHWHVSTHLGAQTIVAANTESQLRSKTFPEISRWITMAGNSHWFDLEGLRVTPAQWFAQLVSDQLKIDAKYWNIQGQTWTEENPESFAGAHNAYGLLQLFDEASGIPAPVWDTADGFFTDRTPYRFHFAASQMRRTSGRFFDLFHDKAFQAQWRTRKLDTRFMPDCVDAEWVRKFIELHGEDSDEVRVEIKGDAPGMGESQFIPTDLVRAAQERNYEHKDNGAALVMGVDPAPRGRTVIRFRQGRNARDCCGADTTIVLQGADNVVIANEVARLNEKWKPDAICVDFGMGTGVIDTLRHTHKLRVVEVRFGETPVTLKSEFATRSAELWGFVREWLNGGEIDRSEDLFRDLTAREWRWSGREDNKKILESKDDLRARGIPSPDDADALACTFAARVPRKDARTARGGRAAQATGAWDRPPTGGSASA